MTFHTKKYVFFCTRVIPILETQSSSEHIQIFLQCVVRIEIETKKVVKNKIEKHAHNLLNATNNSNATK